MAEEETATLSCLDEELQMILLLLCFVTTSKTPACRQGK